MPDFFTAPRAVSVEGERVIKIQEPRASHKERLRTEAGREVGQRTGLFIVPEIVAFDDAGGKIVFERLQLTGIRQMLSNSTESMDLAGKAAEALAAIHRQMEPAAGARESAPETARFGRRPVPLHGDFGMRNIFCLPDGSDIVLIDWSNADWIGTDADLGAPELDIAVFLISLFHHRVLGPWPVQRRHELAHQFLQIYATSTAHGVDIDALRAVIRAVKPGFQQRTRRRKGNLRALAYGYGMFDLNRFLHQLSQDFTGHPKG
jgi:hypothetical protein